MHIVAVDPTRPAYFRSDVMTFPPSFCDLWRNKNCLFRGLTSVVLFFDDNQCDLAEPAKDRFYINKKILAERICTDVTITAGNGARIKCHKNFLSAHSPVLWTMLNTNLECKDQNIDMSDLSEEGVRALLSYLYYWDIDNATESCDIAFQLFVAGHKFDIARLKKCMKDLLLSKHVSWFQKEVAFKLFLFSRNLRQEEDLVAKALQSARLL